MTYGLPMAGLKSSRKNAMIKTQFDRKGIAMYEILIVDDETVEREVIRFLLNKYGFPFAVTEAANGQVAMELLEKRRFHVLFTDIKMPFVGGLELARWAREHYPDLRIVFFSGFDDFEYARQAFSLRIINYILKPVNPEEFRKTMADVLEQLRSEEDSARRAASARGAVRRSALLQLLNGIPAERLKVMYPQWDFGFLEDYHRMLMIRMERRSSLQEEGTYLPWEELQPLLPENSQCLTLKPDTGLVLFDGKRHQTRWYQELAERLVTCIRRLSGSDCRIEISHSFDTAEQICPVYMQLKQTLRDRSFIRADQEEAHRGDETVSDDMMLSRLGTDLRLGDAESFRQHMSALLDSCRKRQSSSGAQIRYLCMKVLTLLLDYLPNDAGVSFDKYAGAIQEEHFSSIERRLLELTERIAAELEAGQQSQNHAVQLAKQYIRKHYGESLSLNMIAEKVHLSPRYLSALFVEEEGIGINRYIKKVRMRKACELLRTTNMKVSEICVQVGYSNLSYFCKSFQDDFGMTPDKYRSGGPGEERSGG